MLCAGCAECWQTLQNTEESSNELLHKAIEKFVHPQSPTNYVNLLHLLYMFGLLCLLNCWSFFWFPPSNFSGTICLMYDAPGKFLLSFASDRSSGNQYETYSPFRIVRFGLQKDVHARSPTVDWGITSIAMIVNKHVVKLISWSVDAENLQLHTSVNIS